MQKIIEIHGGVTRHPLFRMSKPVDFEVLAGEHVAIVGPNGAGKSMLVDILTGAHALLPMNDVKYDFSPSKAKLVSDNIKYLTFRDSYGTTDGTYYYQQRWNQNDIDETPLVSELLDEAFRIADEGLLRQSVYDRFLVREETDEQREERLAQEAEARCQMHAELEKVRKRLFDMFHLEQIADKHVIMLSSGELRKFQMTKTLMTNPRVLIMDNPFIGLDVNARQQLHDFMRVLTEETNVTIILVQSKTDDLPDFITHVYQVENMTVGKKQTLAEFCASMPKVPERVMSPETEALITTLDANTTSQSLPIKGEVGGGPKASSVISFNNVNIRYGSRTILRDLNLTVLQGEHWALSGENGAGKSTLLSIVCADNPQAYANDIVLFGHQRGKGESIWDIKRHIGYISPEMHRAYMKDRPSIDIVASGLSDLQGLYTKPRAEQREQCLLWMRVFGVERYADQSFLKLSSGEQRLVLLARAFVKDPALLILDEPLHGLDMLNRQLVKNIIDTFSRRHGKTLIMVTHYEDELPPCIDHKIFLRKQ